MSTVYADDEQPDALPSPATPRSSRPRLSAVPVAAAVTAAVLGLVQGWVHARWADRHALGIRDVLMKWDAGWMTRIAELGYAGSPDPMNPEQHVEWQTVAFFPGYPVLVRVFSAPLAVFGADDATFLAALLVSAVASLVLACGLARLAVDVWHWSRSAADPTARPDLSVRARVAMAVAVTVLAFGAPMSFIYWMPFSEALFGALAVWALVMMLRRRYLAAGVLTLFAGLTRITAIALVLTLAAVAVAELWRWLRQRTDFPAHAVAAPVVGYLGLAAYLRWADHRVADIGGYFAAQKRGWSSEFDLGRATLRWLDEHTLIHDTSDHDAVAYVLSSWSMILVAVLCLASLWPLWRRWLPWQVWLVAVLVAGSVLGSDGIMHARPRLLLLPVLLLLLPFVVRAVQWATRDPRRALPRGVLLAGVGVLWCALGFWFFGWMIFKFHYGI